MYVEVYWMNSQSKGCKQMTEVAPEIAPEIKWITVGIWSGLGIVNGVITVIINPTESAKPIDNDSLNLKNDGDGASSGQKTWEEFVGWFQEKTLDFFDWETLWDEWQR